ncbi:MAG: polysaccharide biosynthesis/export family protein [Zoogloeaceae bacterium]|jgi:polysaccharide export outer membrane protein|nr:polysaccharide biosynthesis/export family protein [Zoogloeaceae bacterium]
MNMKTPSLFFLPLRLTFFVAGVAGLSGCATPEVFNMPVQVVTAPAEQRQISEIIPVKQVLRPQDVLDVIYYLDASSKTPYRIQAGDQVDLKFLTAGELSGVHRVMPDGAIVLPYVGSMEIGGLTVAEAQQKIRDGYVHLLKRPEIMFSVSRPLAQQENLRQTLLHPQTGMTHTITVNADGRASFPLLGAIALQGMSVEELEQALNHRYAENFEQIHVNVLLKATAANEIFVLGAVNQPGAYPVRRPVSVLEALTLARGTPTGARLDSVVIMRRQGNQVEAHLYDVEKALNGNAEQFAYLQPDDLIYVPKTRLKRIGEISRQLAEVILFNGVGYSFTYRVDDKEIQSYE